MKNVKFLKDNLIMHRGLHTKLIPENTLLSFIRAMDYGYTIELDIHILKDDTIVVYHDFNLNRLTGVNKIIETLNYPQLSNIKIANNYHIPTLSKVMNIINGKVPLLIEIKTIENNVNFYKKLIELLDNYNGLFAIQSINPLVIDYFYHHKKEYPVGLIIYNELNYILLKKYKKMIDFIALNKKHLPMKSKKIVIGWTIKNMKELDKYIDMCDNLIVENIV